MLFAGIDWAATEHAVSVLDAATGRCHRTTVKHTAEGFESLVAWLRRFGDPAELPAHHIKVGNIMGTECELPRTTLGAPITVIMPEPQASVAAVMVVGNSEIAIPSFCACRTWSRVGCRTRRSPGRSR